jgi:tetraacyldisaccharide 4'-kinase
MRLDPCPAGATSGTRRDILAVPMQTEMERKPPLPSVIGEPLSWLYGAVVSRRNRRYDSGRGVVELDRPVVSVGNLSLGGTGKTPLVAHMIRVLRSAGKWACVAMRGYGWAKGREADEAKEYLAEFPDLPLVAQPNRLDGLIDLFASGAGERVDCVILDDGFQHRRIARAMDVVLVDATRSPFEDRLFPAGWLREPVESLGRADAVVLTHEEAVDDVVCAALEQRVREVAPSALVVRARHEWEALDIHVPDGEGWQSHREAVGFIRGWKGFVVCAIGNPEAFLKQCGGVCEVAGSLALRDHDPYMPSTIERVLDEVQRAGAEVILTTRKDWMKLERALSVRWRVPVCVVRLRMRVGGGGAMENSVLRACGANRQTVGE